MKYIRRTVGKTQLLQSHLEVGGAPSLYTFTLFTDFGF